MIPLIQDSGQSAIVGNVRDEGDNLNGIVSIADWQANVYAIPWDWQLSKPRGPGVATKPQHRAEGCSLFEAEKQFRILSLRQPLQQLFASFSKRQNSPSKSFAGVGGW
jgi:hypothetical protein